MLAELAYSAHDSVECATPGAIQSPISLLPSRLGLGARRRNGCLLGHEPREDVPGKGPTSLPASGLCDLGGGHVHRVAGSRLRWPVFFPVAAANRFTSGNREIGHVSSSSSRSAVCWGRSSSNLRRLRLDAPNVWSASEPSMRRTGAICKPHAESDTRARRMHYAQLGSG